MRGRPALSYHLCDAVAHQPQANDADPAHGLASLELLELLCLLLAEELRLLTLTLLLQRAQRPRVGSAPSENRDTGAGAGDAGEKHC